MPRLRGRSHCWAHDEAASTARARARQRGGEARRPTAPPTVPEVPPPAPFDLPRIEKRGDLADALLRVVQALAAGELDRARGRLLVEALRAAHLAWDTTMTSREGDTPKGARQATAAELVYIREHHGKMPPGVVPHPAMVDSFWVVGDTWSPDDGGS